MVLYKLNIYILIIVSVFCSESLGQYNLLAHWQFENDLVDEGINSLNFINNGVTFTTDRFGNDYSAAYFDGSSSFYVSDYDNTSANSISYSFWVKMDNLTSSASTVISGPNHHTIVIGHYKPDRSFVSSSFFAGIDNSSINNDINNDPTPSILKENEWVFLAATNDGTTTRLYINGELASEYGEVLATHKGDLTIGAHTNSTRLVKFKGAIDDFKIYDTVLTSAFLKEEFNPTKKEKEDTLTKNDTISNLIVYEYISPNNDGKNDFLRFDGINIEYIDILLFNKNGKKIYHNQKYNNKDKWTGSNQPKGNYFYIARYKNNILKGYIYLDK